MNKQNITPEEQSGSHKLWKYLKKNGFTILMTIFIGIMFFSPDAKSFVLRQLLATGVFNASLDKKTADTEADSIDFEFTDEMGNLQHTAALRGKVVFINFWASWCPPCRAEFPSVQQLYNRFKDDPKLVFLTINEDNDLAAAKAYLAKENFAIPLYKASGSIPRAIYSGSLPTTVVLDKNGKIRLHHTGFANYASARFIKQIEELISE